MKLIVLFAILGFAQTSSLKSLEEICETFKSTPNLNGQVVDDLCNLFAELQPLNKSTDAKWKVIYATLMYIALNGNVSKTNQTVTSIRKRFSGNMQKTVLTEDTKEVETTTSLVITEKNFLVELESILSKGLDPLQTKEALKFVSEFKTPAGIKKDDHYAKLTFENALGLSEKAVCNIMAKDPKDCKE